MKEGKKKTTKKDAYQPKYHHIKTNAFKIMIGWLFAIFRQLVRCNDTHLSRKDGGTTGSLQLLLGILAEVLGLDHQRNLGQNTLAQHLEVTLR